METILITGGSGTIGTELIQLLLKQQYNLRVLSRSKSNIPGTEVFKWDVEKGEIEAAALKDIDHIIHLAGANVSQSWTKSQKNKIHDSRIKAAHLLFEKLGDQKIKSFISASGISIYGTISSEKIFSENDVPKNYDDNDFLAKVSKDWEAAADQFTEKADRVVKVRTPVVLSRTGGALERIAKPIRMGFGAALGSGKQYVPWVHIDDLVKFYLKALKEESINGSYNIVAPEHINNKQLTQAIAKALDKKLWLPNVPAFMLKLMFGQMANIILKGSRASNEKVAQTGYEFEHKVINEAVKDLL